MVYCMLVYTIGSVLYCIVSDLWSTVLWYPICGLLYVVVSNLSCAVCYCIRLIVCCMLLYPICGVLYNIVTGGIILQYVI